MLWKSIFGIVIAIFLVIGVVYWQAGAIIKSGTETYGPDILKTDVELDSANLSILSGEAKLKGLMIGQPEGFGEGAMISFDLFAMKLRPETLLSNHIIIDDLLISKPMIDARVTEKTSNFEAFAEGILGPTPQSAPSDTVVTIHKLHVIDPSLHVSSEKFIEIDEDVTLESFTLTKLGTDEKGLSFGEIARHIMDVLEPQVAKAMVEIGVKDKVKSLAEKELQKLTGTTDGKLEDTVKGAIGNLLGKKKKKSSDEQPDDDKQ